VRRFLAREPRSGRRIEKRCGRCDLGLNGRAMAKARDCGTHGASEDRIQAASGSCSLDSGSRNPARFAGAGRPSGFFRAWKTLAGLHMARSKSNIGGLRPSTRERCSAMVVLPSSVHQSTGEKGKVVAWTMCFSPVAVTKISKALRTRQMLPS
jgi:hypothetical protein